MDYRAARIFTLNWLESQLTIFIAYIIAVTIIHAVEHVDGARLGARRSLDGQIPR